MSVDPFALFQEGRFLVKGGEGSVSRAVVAAADGVFATMDGTPGGEYGPMPWPFGDTTLPSVGDRILIIEGPYGNPWIASWDPHG